MRWGWCFSVDRQNDIKKEEKDQNRAQRESQVLLSVSGCDKSEVKHMSHIKNSTLKRQETTS